MFKRVQKRVQKRQREEELGLDGDMKEVLGLQDTDSDESDSSSDEDGTDAESLDGDDASGEAGENSVELPADTDEVADEDDDEQEVEESEESEDEDADKIPPMSVTEAVKDSVYIISLDPRVEACILCPGKLLKNRTMSEVHKASKAHNRRFTRFVELVADAGPEADVRKLIRTMNKEAPPPSEVKPLNGPISERGLKRKQKLESLKVKRERKKRDAQLARQRKAEREKKRTHIALQQPAPIDLDAVDKEQPPKKRRKVASDESPASPASEAKAPTQPTTTQKDIAPPPFKPSKKQAAKIKASKKVYEWDTTQKAAKSDAVQAPKKASKSDTRSKTAKSDSSKPPPDSRPQKPIPKNKARAPKRQVSPKASKRV
ncbi:hypothetical protein BDW22DRAFT_1352177 [Trametopsis cervina]|nr:hypothetical protein BDW22DRAFT_1352177 [Trametopsis cervina]